MTERRRLLVFLFGAVGIATIYCAGIRNLPPWGDYRGPYGDVIARLAVYQRHATDTVNAITYDYRGFDTLGEEFILFSAVTGVMLLLRPETDEKKKKMASSRIPHPFRIARLLPKPFRFSRLPSSASLFSSASTSALTGSLRRAADFRAV